CLVDRYRTGIVASSRSCTSSRWVVDMETEKSARPETGAPQYNPYTGAAVVAGVAEAIPAAAALGLEPPRYCVQCGRRMVVQVDPQGWWAKCSRHGVIDSKAATTTLESH